MCDTSVCAAELAELLAGEDRSRALAVLTDDGSTLEKSEMSGWDQECVEKMLGELAPVLATSHLLDRWDAYEALRLVSFQHPFIARTKLEEIHTHANPDDEKCVGDYTEALLNIAEATPDAIDELPEAHLRVLCNVDPNEPRATAVKLLRYRSSLSSLETLIDKLSYEIPPVEPAVESVLRDRRDDALSQLSKAGEGGEEESTTTLRELKYLARHGPDFVIERSTQLRELFDTPAGESAAEILGTALAEFPDESTLTALKTDVEIDSNQSVEARQQAEQAVLALVDAGKADDIADDVVGRCRGWLGDEDTRIREHALTQLRRLAESNPELVEAELTNIGASAREDSELEAQIGEVLRVLGKERGGDGVSYLKTVLKGRSDSSAVNHLVRTADALRYNAPVETGFEKLEHDRLERGALEDLHEAVSVGRTSPFVWPSFDPSLATLFAIELLLDNFESGDDVILFSPGSRKHWGLLKEVRNEYARYGVEVERDRGVDTVPLPSILPHARVSGSKVKEHSNGEGDSRFIIMKRLDELEAIDAPAAILLNLSSRTKETYDATIDDLIDQFEETTILPFYSNLTKHEYEQRRAPRYGPPGNLEEVDTLPGVNTLEASLDSDPVIDDIEQLSIEESGMMFNRLVNPGPLEITHVDDDGLLDILETGYEASSELRENNQKSVAGRIFSRLMLIERFPFPVSRYESWVYEERKGGGLYGPRTVQSSIDNLQTYASSIDELSVASEVFKTAEHLGYARDALEEENPMYDALCSRIEATIDAGDSLAIFMPKPTWSSAAESILLNDGIITDTQLDEGTVQIVDPDSARTLEPCDELLITGPQRPQYTYIYLHPCVERTTMLAYRGEWDWMVERNIQNYVDQLNAAAAGLDYEPYSVPEQTIREVENPSWLEEEGEGGFGTVTKVSDREPIEAESQPSGMDTSARSGRKNRQTLAELFDIAGEDDYAGSSHDRYDDYEQREFRIKTESGEILDQRSRVIRRRDSVNSKGRYHWVSPSSLAEGDTIVVIDDDVYQELLNEWLSDVYSEELGDTDAFTNLQRWHDMIRTILEEAIEETGATSSTNPAVRRWILRQTGGIDRKNATIWRWFTSVARADSPIDCAQDPDLTIGPERAEDIESIARIFEMGDIQKADAVTMEESMKRIRGTNIRQGHELRKSVLEDMNSLNDNKVKDASIQHKVAQVEERT